MGESIPDLNQALEPPDFHLESEGEVHTQATIIDQDEDYGLTDSQIIDNMLK